MTPTSEEGRKKPKKREKTGSSLVGWEKEKGTPWRPFEGEKKGTTKRGRGQKRQGT